MESLPILEPKFLKRRDSAISSNPPGESQTALDRIRSVLSIPPKERTESQVNTVVGFSKNIKFFSDLRESVGEYAHYQCCRQMTHLRLPPGKAVFYEGESGSKFYILISGSCAVVSQSHNLSGPPDFHLLTILRPGDSFGELSLISKRPRAATVLCREGCNFAVLDRDHYTETLERTQKRQLQAKIKLLQQHPLFAAWDPEVVRKFSYFFVFRSVRRQQSLFTAGHSADEVFLIQEGTFHLTKEVQVLSLACGQAKQVKKETEVMTARPGELLGAASALKSARFDCTCVCASAFGSALVIEKRNFKRFLSSESAIKSLLEIDRKREDRQDKRLKAAVRVEEAKHNGERLSISASMPQLSKQSDSPQKHVAASQVFRTSEHRGMKALGFLYRRAPSLQNLTLLADAKQRHKRSITDIAGLSASAYLDMLSGQPSSKPQIQQYRLQLPVPSLSMSMDLNLD